MVERGSLRWPILLGVVMFIVLVALLAGWVVLSVYGLLADSRRAVVYVVLLSAGAALLTLAIVGTAIYLTLTVKAINLSQRQSNFIDSVTHELKSPIASLKLYLQTLHRRPQMTPEERQTFVRDMLEDVERLDQLINHLLDAARLQRQPSGATPEAIRLDQLVQKWAEQLRTQYGAAPEALRLSLLPAEVQAVRGDIELVVRNLLDNAFKYASDEEPYVEVTLAPAGPQRVLLCVSDNGRGIPPGLRQSVFGRFVRLGSELIRDRPGTGLGLYLVRTVVNRLGGSIRIRDRGGEPGTTFEVELAGTILPAEPSAAPPSPLAAPAGQAGPAEPAAEATAQPQSAQHAHQTAGSQRTSQTGE
jgi:signal transduction histidine kinase